MRQINIEVPVGAGGVKIEQRIAVYGNFFAVIEAKKNIIVRPDTGDISAATGFQMEKGDNLRLTTHFETLWIKAGPDQTETEIVKIIVGEGEFNKQATLGEVTVGEITGEVSIDGEVSTRGVTTVDGTVTIDGEVQVQGVTETAGILRTAPDYSALPPTDFANVYNVRYSFNSYEQSPRTNVTRFHDPHGGLLIRPGGQNNNNDWHVRILECSTTNVVRPREGGPITDIGSMVIYPVWLFGISTDNNFTTRLIDATKTKIRKLNLNDDATAPDGSVGGLPFARAGANLDDRNLDIIMSKDTNGAVWITDTQGVNDNPTGISWQLGSTDWTDVDGYYAQLDNGTITATNPIIAFFPLYDIVNPEGNDIDIFMDLNLKVAIIPV